MGDFECMTGAGLDVGQVVGLGGLIEQQTVYIRYKLACTPNWHTKVPGCGSSCWTWRGTGAALAVTKWLP